MMSNLDRHTYAYNQVSSSQATLRGAGVAVNGKG